MSRHRIPKLGALIKPATLLKFHRALIDRKYRRLFASSYRRRKPGPKGPSTALIAAIIELKRRNTGFGCVRIGLENLIFEVPYRKPVSEVIGFV